MTDDERTKGPIGQAIDTFVYAPIGLFFDAPSLLPKLVEDGKNHAKGARVFGEFAVRQGRAELQRRLGHAGAQAEEVLRTLGILPDDEAGPPGPGTPVDMAASRAGTAPASGNGASADVERPAAEADVPAAETLAITDYDSLSASQVVTRLEGLEPDELEAVRAYESAHRGRKTILNKVAQIQA